MTRIKDSVQRWLLWLVMDSPIRLGPLAPWIFGLAIGRMPHKKTGDECEQG